MKDRLFNDFQLIAKKKSTILFVAECNAFKRIEANAMSMMFVVRIFTNAFTCNLRFSAEAGDKTEDVGKSENH